MPEIRWPAAGALVAVAALTGCDVQGMSTSTALDAKEAGQAGR